MTIDKQTPLTKPQLMEIKALSQTLVECATYLANLFARRHPNLTDAEFMIATAHQKIHTTLKQLGIDF